ncbi:phosphoenolpyruvate--protein phosphotransferase [Tessaracoccus sp. OH4464_COT-324]|uniref:phosphoenolpyruvate--protein phosphotransferase n=1 Tax=Tessaracoccus sp. OH4464_COT-324 TaxID=2491059 RepID=UPI000F632171|nr:putative PEP-binding protein [Tessaracoccus sp. OH4464_COT-324]RRD46110.1 phosphoenolpyruvate--protein phosphotransferase [Tessaracoccus sp. OH4464_COT-324]
MTLTGIGASPGFAQGKVVVASFDIDETLVTERLSGKRVDLDDLLVALEVVARDFDRRAETLDDDSAEVLRAAGALAADPALIAKIRADYRTAASPMAALRSAFDHFARLLGSLGSYMAERVPDLRDVHRRALAYLAGLPLPGVPEFTAPAILVARDISPADMSLLDRELVLAIITEEGSPTSHTAVLAAQRGIPMVVGCIGILAAAPTVVAVNAATGEVLMEPKSSRWEGSREQLRRRQELLARSSGPGQTLDGHRVELLANIGNADDLLRLTDADVEGIGLLRTEFLFLNRATAPSVKEQREVYQRVFDAMGSRKVVVRTLDAGSDKPLRFVPTPREENPALGRRGVRQYRSDPRLLRTQLCAISEAAQASTAEVWTMAPMAATVEEVEWFVDFAHDCGLANAGVMLEVPGLALLPEATLAAADFVSVGSNDLVQYLMAADRQSVSLAHLHDGWHPSLWRLLKYVGDANVDVNRPIGLCGIAGGNPVLALLAVGAGVTSLSMAASRMPAVRTALSLHSRADCERLLGAALSCASAAEAKNKVSKLLNPEVSGLL